MAASILTALGKSFDLSPCIVPYDSQSGASTGKRISLIDCEGIGILIQKAVGVGADVIVPLLYEHTASVSGTSTLLASITKSWYKSETTLDGDETWTALAQTASSTLTYATVTQQSYLYFEVRAEQLTDGYTHISVDIADTGAAGTQPIAVTYIKFGLKSQRIPSNLPNCLNPGAANA
jgi:hypothetical protein